MTTKYTVELWTADGRLLADLSGRARSRKLIKSRNEADEIDWQLDLNEFERYCSQTNQDPKDLLIPGQTEVRIRRGESYLGGGKLDYFNPQVDANQAVIDVKATGFLSLFKDRFTDAVSYTATEATTIAANLITGTQGKGPNWDYGVTIGTLATVGPHDRTYDQDVTAIKDALQDLTKVQTNPFDFEFTADKVFNTYAAIGSSRPDIIFELPGNIKSFAAPVDGTRIENYVTAYGQGFGDYGRASYVAQDINSQITYKVRQAQLTSNATDNSDNGLTDMANSELAAWAYPFQVPPITVNGNIAPFITDYGIGDYIRVRCTSYKIFSHIDALYRLEKYELNVDDNDNEDITLYVSI